jgi:hypothetical protein
MPGSSNAITPSSPPSRPSRTLVLAAALLFVVCVVAIVEHEGGLAIGFATLALGGAALAVFQPHIHNFKAGPQGFEIETVRREEIQLAAQLRRRLGGIGIVDLASGVAERPPDDSLHGLTESLGVLQFMAEEESPTGYSPDPAAQFELARGLLAEQAWPLAAEMLDRYTRSKPEDWEAQYARGVAHANSRAGESANLAALHAYNDALVFVPRAHANAWLPRLYAYRGAMLKRLDRLAESESDLLLARRLASGGDERNDISYNLAAVYAMSGKAPEALSEIRSLVGTPFIEAIQAHSDDYFESLADNEDFQALVDRRSQEVEPAVDGPT